MKTVLVLSSLILLNAIVYAQEDSTFRNIELPAAVIQANNPTEETQVKGGEVVLKKKNIQKLNTAVDVPYIIQQTPATVVGSDAGTGVGYTNIRIRGTDITRINVNMNGIPINDAEGQGVFFVNFPDILGSANSISIERGIGNSRAGYGSFGGAISINNIDINYKEPHFNFMADYGSFNTLKNSIKASTGMLNNRFITTVRLSHIVSDGFIDRSAAQLRSAQITSKFYFSPDATLTFNYLTGQEKTQQAWNGVLESNLDSARTYNELGMKADGSFYDNQTDNYQQDYYQLFFDKKIRNINKQGGVIGFGAATYFTKGKGYYEEYKLEQEYAAYGLPVYIKGTDTTKNTDLIRQLWLDNDYLGFRAYVNYISPKIQGGLYFNSSNYYGKHFGEIIWATAGVENDFRWYDLDARKSDNNIYGMFSYKLRDDIQLFADLQYRSVRYEVNGFRQFPNIQQDLRWNFVNPKVEFRYAPSKKTSLSIFLAQSTKEPNRDDFEANATEIPRPERLTDYEFNWHQQIYKKLKLHTTLYYMDYKDQLVLTGKINDVGAYARTNIGQSYRTGLEIVAMYQPNNHVILQGNVNVSKNKINAFSAYVDDYDNGGQIRIDYSNRDISFSPNIIAGGQLSFYPWRHSKSRAFRESSIDILPKFVGRQYLDNTQNINRSIKPFSTTDILVNIEIESNHRAKYKIRAGLMNILNEQYESNGYTYSFVSGSELQTFNYFYPQAGRRWSFGFGLEF